VKILDVLRKLGILRMGGKAAVYRSTKDRPAEFMMDDAFDADKDLSGRKSDSPVHSRLKRSGNVGHSSYTSPDFD
jgi:hypothetical protein